MDFKTLFHRLFTQGEEGSLAGGSQFHGNIFPPYQIKNPVQGCRDRGQKSLRGDYTRVPEGPSTQYLRFLVPKTTLLMIYGTRELKHWVLGPWGCMGSSLKLHKRIFDFGSL